MLIFSIYFANSNNVSLSSNTIQILWSCAGVSKDACPSSILLLLSSSPFPSSSLFFNKESWAWWLTSYFSFSFRRDDELFYDCHDWRTVFDVMFVNGQSKECAKHNLRGNKFERAQNVQDSYVESLSATLIYVCGIGGVWAWEFPWFYFWNKFLQVLELQQVWIWINVS